MIRYLFSIGFLVFCSGLPLQAKYVAPSLPSPSSLTKGKSDSTPVPSSTKGQKEKASATAKSDTKSSSATASTSTSKKHETSGPVAKTSSSSTSKKQQVASSRSRSGSGERLARLTAYWAGEGDYYTGRGLSSTGIHLHGGHCAVDPRIIPYGSVVKIAGVGTYVAVNTGSAAISREAARETGHTAEERNALVIDLFFEHRRDGERFAANGPKFASITWQTPHTADNELKNNRDLYADDNSDKTHKQL